MVNAKGLEFVSVYTASGDLVPVAVLYIDFVIHLTLKRACIGPPRHTCSFSRIRRCLVCPKNKNCKKCGTNQKDDRHSMRERGTARHPTSTWGRFKTSWMKKH